MAEVVIDGIRYVPAASIPPSTERCVTVAVLELVTWLHLRDKPDNHVWAALQELSPDLHALAGGNPSAAYEAAFAAASAAAAKT